MAVIHGAVRLDRVFATKNSNGLISFKNTNSDQDNGTVFFAQDLISGERELFAATPLSAVATQSLFVNASVETVYLAGQTILDYYTPMNTAGRGIRPIQGDVITITNAAITGTTVVGQYVQPVNGSYNLSASATLPTTKFIGKVIATENIYGQPATVIEVLSN